MNVKLLEEVKDRIRKQPINFDMHDWFRNSGTQGGVADCGTAGCIAGWCCIVSYQQEHNKATKLSAVIEALNTDPGWGSAESEAVKLLELEHGQAARLFYITSWPEPFRSEYAAAQEGCKKTGGRDYAKQAEIACRRIDHFIKEGK